MACCFKQVPQPFLTKIFIDIRGYVYFFYQGKKRSRVEFKLFQPLSRKSAKIVLQISAACWLLLLGAYEVLRKTKQTPRNKWPTQTKLFAEVLVVLRNPGTQLYVFQDLILYLTHTAGMCSTEQTSSNSHYHLCSPFPVHSEPFR